MPTVWRLVFLAGLLGACSSSDPGPASDASVPLLDAAAGRDGGVAPAAIDARVDASVDAYVPPKLPEHCATEPLPPNSIDCIGLYTNVTDKTIAAGVRAYVPAMPLWSDGAEKQRYILLPEGTTIDDTDVNEWLFPIGTKLFKEFSTNGQRVETRMWHKVKDNFWVNAVYAWNADETAATRSAGGDIITGRGPYHIPTQEECEKCHRGRTEHVLGFEAVNLGLSGASGMTLDILVRERRIVPPPAQTHLSFGDGGGVVAAPALSWLHTNCGVSCHNENSRAIGYSTGERLRLDPRLLDGRNVTSFDTYTTTIGVTAKTPNWQGQTRIVPARPDLSLVYQLITHRGLGVQMPPFASSIIDPVNSAVIGEWIRQMPPLPSPDAGVGDAI